MASAFFLTTIVIVVLAIVNSERPFLHYPKYVEKALPRHWEHDKEKLNRNVEQDARGSQVGARPRLSPLYNPERAAHADESLKRVRVDLLKSKLMPHLPQRNVVAHGKPVPKPDNEPHQRHKREVEQTLPEEEGKGTIREKRTVMINQPEMVMQPHIQPALTHDKETKYQEKVTEKRDKRQIIYLINQRPLLFAKKPRKTTPNPFDREADIADYEIMRPTPEGLIPAAVETDEDIDTGSYLLSRFQSLSQYFQNTKIKIGQSYPIEMITVSNKTDVKEDSHIRVKRRMSKFRRDRKQITRKKKFGRRKKTKVRRAPIKVRRWYDKRQKEPKKGDGTYRGGRGRIPRQHKKPLNKYQPPQNETSDYDYYDDDGKIRVPSGETQEGSDDAAYVSYGTGEYEDTAEAEAAQQELEKEYQMQVVKEKKRAERRKLSNGTVESTEEISSLPLVESEESGKSEDDEEIDEEEYEDEEESGDEEEGSDYTDSGDGSDSGGGGNDKNKGKLSRDKENIQKGKSKQFKKTTGKTIGSSNKIKGLRKNSGKESIKEKSKHLQNVRLAAKKYNFVSHAKMPSFMNALSPIGLRMNRPSNRMSDIKFESPQKNVFKNLQSMPLKNPPDTFSFTNPALVSSGGKNLQNLQSQKVFSAVESTSHDKKLSITSTARDKSENPLVFTSKTKDNHNTLTSLGSQHMKHIQSLTIDPVVLTSIAKHIPELRKEDEDKTKLDLKDKNVKTEKSVGTVFSKRKAGLENSVKSKRSEKSEANHAAIKPKTIVSQAKTQSKIKKKLHVGGSDTYEESVPETYEELSSVPDRMGVSVGSDEMEPAPDDKIGKR